MTHSPLALFAIAFAVLSLLFVYGACVVSGRISEDERQREDAAQAQKIEDKDAK